jgi:hypothetical protein
MFSCANLKGSNCTPSLPHSWIRIRILDLSEGCDDRDNFCLCATFVGGSIRIGDLPETFRLWLLEGLSVVETFEPTETGEKPSSRPASFKQLKIMYGGLWHK